MAKLDFYIDDNGCFICNSHVPNTQGYVQLEFRGSRVRAHRLVYQECFGEIPEGLMIRHKCDNPTCINPEHLETGTNQDNMNDMKERGRTASRLTEEQVLDIRFNLKLSVQELSNKYGITVSSVRKIIFGETWKHVRG